MRPLTEPALPILGMKSCAHVALLLLLLVHLPGDLHFAHAGSDTTWEELGGVQVLESHESVFVFLQVDNVIEHKSPLSTIMSTHPTKRIISQQRITIDGKGNKVETPIIFSDAEGGPSLDSNGSRIFVFKGKVFLIRFETKPALPTLYRWEEARFVRVHDGKSGELMKIMILIRDANLRADQEAALDNLTKDSGWRYIESDSPLRYVSKLHNIHIKLLIDDRKNTLPRVKSVVSESLSPEKSWTKTLIDLRIGLHKGQKRTPTGHAEQP
jgi:hypothetical protein